MRVASWNVNLFEPSQHATWTRDENERRIRQTLLGLDVDVLALQEVPSPDFSLDGFDTCASAKSHSGYCLLLSKTPGQTLALPGDIPAAGACVSGFDVVSVHLAPGARAAEHRARQMCKVFAAVGDSGRAVVLGDTNMRESEAPETSGLRDAWKDAGRPAQYRFSWDSRRNDFHSNAAPGGFMCRFDRAYVKGVDAVRDLRLFADSAVEGGAFLSDHFGLVLSVDGTPETTTTGPVTWKSVLAPEEGLYRGPAPTKPTCDGTYAPPAHRDKLLSRKNAHARDARIHFHEGPHKYVVDGEVMSKSVTGIAGELHSHFDEDDAIVKMKRKRDEPWPKLRYCLSARPYVPGETPALPMALFQDSTDVTRAHVSLSDAAESVASVEARLRAQMRNEVGPGTVHVYERSMTAAEIKLDWQKNRERASAEGTEAHYQMELLLNNEAYRAEDPEVDVGKSFLTSVVAPLGLTIYRTEWEIFCEEAHFAGSVDAIFQKPDGTLVIVDWKRSEKLPDKMTSNYARMKHPLQHLEDCDGAKYALQLSLYRYVLEHCYGFRCAELFLCSIHPTRPFHFQVPYLEAEAASLVQGRVKWFSRWRAASEQSPPELHCTITGRLPLEPLQYEGKMVDGAALVELHEAMQKECSARGLISDGSALALATRLAEDGGPAFAVRPVPAETAKRVRDALPVCEFELEPQANVRLA